MKRCLIVALILAMMLSSAQVGHAREQGCSDAAARRALDEALTPRTWNALYTSYKAYRQCDDGAIGEGYSESVARILVDHWKTLPELNRIAQKDAQFRRFVLRHLDATLNMDDVENIKRKAVTQCPSGLNRLCSEVLKQADTAMQE